MPQDRLQKLFDVMSSQTKSHIIAPLSIGGKMTVTQISKHINTSRSNLYQAISDLQEQGFVNPPDIVVRKNYVEKYYSLNDSAFNQTTSGEINEEFMKMSPDKLRNLMATFLLSQSLNLRVIAQEILNVSDEHFLTGVEKLKPYMDYILSGGRNDKDCKGSQPILCVFLVRLRFWIPFRCIRLKL